MVRIGQPAEEVPAELRLLADQLCHHHGIPRLHMGMTKKLNAARYNGAGMRIDIPANFTGQSDYERWSVAHEVGHAYRHVHKLDQAREQVDHASSRALLRFRPVVVIALVALVFVIFGVLWWVVPVGIFLTGLVVLVVGEVRRYVVTRPDEAAADVLAREWGYPLSHGAVPLLARAEPWWQRPLPVWARSHPRPMDRHFATAIECDRCRPRRLDVE